MSDPYGTPQDDPYRATPWSEPEDRPTQPAPGVPQQPQVPPAQPGPAWTPPASSPPGPAYPPTQSYPPVQPYPTQPSQPYQPQPGPTYQPGQPYQPGSAYPTGPTYQPGSAYPTGPAYQPGPTYPTGPYGQPGPYGVDPEARRRRRTLTAVLASVAVVLVVGAVVLVVALTSRPATRNSAGGGTSGTPAAGSGSPGTGQSTAPAGGGSYTLNAPDTIGSLKKTADQSEADDLKNSLQDANLGQIFAAEYQDTAAGNKPVIVWGATGGPFGILDARSQLDAFFNGVGKSVSGGTVGTASAVDAGSVGGTAECAAVTGHVNATLCAWTAGDALVGVIFGGESLSQGGGQMHAILPAVVSKK